MSGSAPPEPSWTEPARIVVPDALSELCQHPLLARLLAARGLVDPVLALEFLDPDRRSPMDPHDVPGLAMAVERVEVARASREPVLIWGDFDADGQTATAVLVLALRRLGIDCTWYVPDRVAESHGLSAHVVAEAARAGARLVITCDCGVGDLEQIAALRAVDIDTIVTDHHPWTGFSHGQPHPAHAIVTPRRLPAHHPGAHLSGVGAAYLLAAALLTNHELPSDDLLDLVALGTIADVALMVGENRHLAQRGLPALNSGRRVGIRALLNVAGRPPVASRDSDVAGWVLAPRLNAFGRLARGEKGVRLLLTDDPDEARALAIEANALNLDRQRQCDGVFGMARDWVESALGGDLPALNESGAPRPLPEGPNTMTHTSLFLADPTWHPGIVGLAASRLGDAYRRPVALATVSGSIARISMRSGAPWADLSRAIQEIEGEAHLGFRGGGHRGAAGGSLPAERLTDLAGVFARTMASQAPLEPLEQSVAVDAELSLPDLTLETCNALARLQPFGPGNPAPILLVRAVRLSSPPRTLGSSGRHFRLSFVDTNGVYAGAVWWDGAPARVAHRHFDALASMERNDFNGTTEIRLVVRAIRPAESGAAPPPLRQGALLL